MPDPFLLFQFPDAAGIPRQRCFSDPVGVIVAHNQDQVRPALREAQRALGSGLWAAGYIAYEAALGLDPALKVWGAPQMPLLWLGLFQEPSNTEFSEGGGFCVGDWHPSMEAEVWARNVAAVREAIVCGDTYQVNLTLRFRARFSPS